jgi:hypothetical protein
MKKNLYFFSGIIMLLCLSLTSAAKADFNGSTCFTDDEGGMWRVNYAGPHNNVSINGTVNIGGGLIWNVWGRADIKNSIASVELHAINPSPDGCTFYVDSFIFVGTITLDRSGTQFQDFGSGTWNSWCGCTLEGTGHWATVGPCHGPSQFVNPNGPAVVPKELTAFRNALSKTCFVDNFGSLWEFHYTVPQCGLTYYIKGQVDLGLGVNWKVWGFADISHGNGYIELHAVNPNPDGCTELVDSLIYVGSITITKVPGLYTFTEKGLWYSYCFGGLVVKSGRWRGTGPCDLVPGLVKPDRSGPAFHNGASFKFSVSPNPLISNSTISYELPKDSRLKLTIYNYMQQPVRFLADKNETAGRHTYTFDGKSSSGADLPNGVYRVVAIVDGKTYTSSLQIMR